MYSPKFCLLLLCLFLAAWSIESETYGPCPEGWDKFEDSCYMYDETPSNFESAQAACNAIGGYVAEVSSAAENDYLFALKGETAGKVWIGLTDEGQEGSFYWANSGNPVDYTNWKTGEPNNVDDVSEDCVEMIRKGWWNDQNCGDENQFFCERDACPVGWSTFGKSCYSVFANPSDFDTAQAACNTMGGYVAEVDSADENAFLFALKGETAAKVWIGLTDKDQEGSFYGATSGIPVDYTNWKTGEPNNVDAVSEDCVEMIRKGWWNDQNCGDENNYFCELW